MGIDVHGLNFLRFARVKSKAFGNAATIGRQQIHISDRILSSSADLHCQPKRYDYCETLLLKDFHATSVESFDASPYEGATIIADFNKPLPPSKLYDTVIDFGSSEHVFDVAQALSNIDNLCKVGGQILHLLPANNYCGHGFWQFSPELFFSLYSENNGYSETEVFLMNVSDTKVWYKVNTPNGRERVNLISRTPVYVACRSVKSRAVPQKTVQQSDYVHVWNTKEQSHAVAAKNKKSLLRHWPSLSAQLKKAAKSRLSLNNPQLLVCKVGTLLSRDT